MKKFLVSLICFMCIIRINSVSAIEGEDTNIEEKPPVTEEVEPTPGDDKKDDEEKPPVEEPKDETKEDEPKHEEKPEEVVDNNPVQVAPNNTQTPKVPQKNTATDPKRSNVPKSNVNVSEDNIAIEISNIDDSTKEKIVGSKLQIQDATGKVLYEWETTSETYVIDELDAGTYYLVQLSVPKGYKLNEEKIEFIVGSEPIKLEISNEMLKTDSKVVLTSNSILLFVAMFDIALGIGIVTYVKKIKTEK